MRDFIRLGEDEIDVFQRLMECGPSARVLSVLPLQLSEIVQRKINAERLQIPKGLEAEVSVRWEGGGWSGAVEWSAPASGDIPDDSRRRALLMLRVLLDYLAGVDWSGHGVLPEGSPDAAKVFACGRLKDEVARLFWLGFVVDRIGRDAVRRKQRAAATGNGPEQVRFARKLQQQGVERSLAVKRLAEHFGVTQRRASKVLADIGWSGHGNSKRGRKKKSE